MKVELDVHTHTVASGHAFSSLQEMAQAAAGKGLKLLGITEHAPSIPGTCNPIYFRNLYVVPRHMYGIYYWVRKLIFLTVKVTLIWMSFI